MTDTTPQPSTTPATQYCGHPMSETVSSTEGTAYCAACEREASTTPDAPQTPTSALLSDDELAAIRKRHEKRSAFYFVDAAVRELHADRGRLLAHIEHLQQRYVRTLGSLLAEAEAICVCSNDYTRRGRTAPDCQAHDFADLIRDALAGESRETER